VASRLADRLHPDSPAQRRCQRPARPVRAGQTPQGLTSFPASFPARGRAANPRSGVKKLQELRYHISRSLLRRYVPTPWEDALVSPENLRLAATRAARQLLRTVNGHDGPGYEPTRRLRSERSRQRCCAYLSALAYSRPHGADSARTRPRPGRRRRGPGPMTDKLTASERALITRAREVTTVDAPVDLRHYLRRHGHELTTDRPPHGATADEYVFTTGFTMRSTCSASWPTWPRGWAAGPPGDAHRHLSSHPLPRPTQLSGTRPARSRRDSVPAAGSFCWIWSSSPRRARATQATTTLADRPVRPAQSGSWRVLG
jgi:hypothetical protein